MADDTSINAVELATELTIAWLGNQNNHVQADDVPAFLRRMHETVLALESEAAAEPEAASEPDEAETFTPAVSVRKSLGSKDHILSLIDGKPYKALRRHLTKNGLTPDQYRERYKLKPDYPMVSENYSEVRRAMAHKIGLGQKGRQANGSAAETAAPEAATPEAAPAPVAKPKRAPRKPKAAKTDA